MSKNLLRPISVMMVWCLVVPAANTQPLAKARTDPFGDPLPEGAIARLGTTRWRLHECPLVFAPNGRFAIVADNDLFPTERTRLLDPGKGNVVREFPVQSWDAFVTGDNKTIILGHHEKIRWLDIDTGKITRELAMEGNGWRWSADGKRLVYKYQIKGSTWGCCVLNLEKGGELCRVAEEYWDCALSTDGSLLAIRSIRTITVFDVAAKKLVCKWASEEPFAGRTPHARVVLFLPDGKTLIAAESKRVLLWDPATGKPKAKGKLGAELETARDDAATLSTSTDGRYLAAGGSKGTIYLWDLQAEVLLHTLPDVGKGLPIYNLNFSPDGKRLVSQTHLFPSARVWDVASGKELTPRKVADSNIDAMKFAADGKALATTGQMDPIQMWDAVTGKLLRNLEHPGKILPFFNRNCPFVLTSSGRALVTSWHNEAIIWNLADGKLRHHVKTELPNVTFDDHRHFRWTTCCPDDDAIIAVFSGDLRRVVPGRRGSPPQKIYWTMIGIADAKSGKIQRSFRAEADSLDRFCLSPDGRMLAAVGQGLDRTDMIASVFVWDLQREVEVFHWDGIPKHHGCESLTFSSDGRSLFLTTAVLFLDQREHLFQVFETPSGKVQATFMHVLEPNVNQSRGAIASDRLAAISKGTTISLFDPKTGKEYRQLQSGQEKIGCLAFSLTANG